MSTIPPFKDIEYIYEGKDASKSFMSLKESPI